MAGKEPRNSAASSSFNDASLCITNTPGPKVDVGDSDIIGGCMSNNQAVQLSPEKQFAGDLHSISTSASDPTMINNVPILVSPSVVIKTPVEDVKVTEPYSSTTVIIDGMDEECPTKGLVELITEGTLLVAQNKLDEAILLYKLILKDQERSLGADQDSTMQTVSTLAYLYFKQDKLDEALPLYERLLSYREKTFGVYHLFTLDSVCHLANLYSKQDKLDESQSLLERLVSGMKENSGADHPDTIISMRLLASVLEKQALVLKKKDKLDEALPLYEHILKCSEKSLGANHPDTLLSANNVAEILEKQSKVDEAKSMYERILSGKEANLGFSHPDTLKYANTVASFLVKQSKLDDAFSLYERILTDKEANLGFYHPDTVKYANIVALFLEKQKKLDKALPLYERVLSFRESTLGIAHPDTLRTVNTLAPILKMQGKLSQAQTMYEVLLRGREISLGSRHPDTVIAINYLADLLEQQNKLDEAKKMFARALNYNEDRVGDGHPDTLSAMNALALVIEKQNKLGEALPLFERELSGREKGLGIDHTHTLRLVNKISGLILRQWKFRDWVSFNLRYLNFYQRFGSFLLLCGVISLCFLRYGYWISYIILYCGLFIVNKRYSDLNLGFLKALVYATLIGATASIGVRYYLASENEIWIIFVADCFGVIVGIAVGVKLSFTLGHKVGGLTSAFGGGAVGCMLSSGVIFGATFGIQVINSVITYYDANLLTRLRNSIFYSIILLLFSVLPYYLPRIHMPRSMLLKTTLPQKQSKQEDDDGELRGLVSEKQEKDDEQESESFVRESESVDLFEKPQMEKRGVTLPLLKAVAASALGMVNDKKHWSMGMLSYAVIGNHETLKQDEESSRWKGTPVDAACTLSYVTRSSLISMLEINHKVKPHPVLNVVYDQAVGKANVFLSFAYLDNFIEMVDAIECFLESSGLSKETTFFWFDVLVNNQWVALDKDFEWWSTTFREAVSDIGHTLLFLSPCLKPTMLTRAWCLYEISCSEKISIALSKKEVAAFHETLRRDDNSIIASLCKIDLEKCTTYDPEDQRRIFEAVRSRGGFQAFNVRVTTLLRDWIRASALEMIDDIKDEDASKKEVDDLIRTADLLATQNNLDEAHRMYKRALIGQERIVGVDHPDRLRTMYNLAGLLYKQNKLDEAKSLYDHVLRGMETTLGVDHPDTLNSMSALAALLYTQDKVDESIRMFQRVLSGRTRRLGADDPESLRSASILSMLQSQTNEKSTVDSRIHGSNDEWSQAVGHRAKWSVMNMLKELLYDHDFALYEHAPSSDEISISDICPDTLNTVNTLAILYERQCKYDEICALYEQELSNKDKSLGVDHPSTLISVNKLADFLHKRNQLDKARPLYERALYYYENSLGICHSSSMVVLKNLALLLISQQKVGDAIHLYERDLWGRVENLGIDHTDTMKAVCNLGNFLAKHGKFWDCFRLIMTYFTIHQRVGCLLLMSGIVALCLGYGYWMSYSFLYCGMYLVYWKLEGFNDILFQALVCAIIIGATVNVVTAYMSKGADVGLFVGDCVGALAGASLSIRIWFLGGGALSHKGAPIGVMIGSFVGYSIKSSVTAYIDSSALCAAVCLIYYFNEKLGFYRNTLRFGETILIFILFVLCFAVFTVCLQYYLFCNSGIFSGATVDFRVLWFLLGFMSQAKFGVLIAHFFTLAGILAVSISYTSVGCCFFLALPVAIMHFPGIDKRFNELLKDTPKGREKSPVFDSSIVLNEKLHNLNQLGMLDEAFALYESVLSGRENSVVDVRIMHSMTTLAILLEQHNKLEKAEIMYTHILGFREQRLGLSHPSTLIIANSLVILLYRQNRPEEALALHERALKGREKNIRIAYVDAVPSMNEREMSEAEMARRGCIALGTFTFGIVYLLLRFFYIDWVFYLCLVSYIYHVRLHVLIVHGFVIGGVTLCICYGSISSNFIFKLIFTAIAMFAVSFFWIAFFDIRLQQKCSKLFYGSEK